MAEVTMETAKRFRVDLNAAIASLGVKYGMKIAVGNIRFSPDSIKTSIEGKNLDESGEIGMTAHEEQTMLLDGRLHGFPYEKGVLAKQCFLLPGGKKVKIVGYNRRAQKFPIIVKDVASEDRMKIAWSYLKVAQVIE